MTVYNHKYSGTLPAGDIFNFSWHSNSGLPLASSQANAVSWINELWTLSASAIAALYTPGTVITKVTTYALNPIAPFNTVGVAADDVALAGTTATLSLPQDVSALVTLRSADPSRKGRGRFYLPAFESTHTTAAGTIPAHDVAQVVSALSDAWSLVNATGEQPIIFSRSTGLFNVVNKFGMGTVYDTQRRRVNKVNTVRSFDPMP